MTEAFIHRILEAAGTGAVRTGEPMEKHTTFRIGGPADLFVRPESAEQCVNVLRICREAEVPFFVLGNGSNLLVSDAGYRGVILQLDQNFQEYSVDGCRITAQAGLLLSRLAQAAKNAALTGLEYASGIPGTVGGGVMMNAGAYGGEIKDSLKEAVILTEELEIRRIPASDLDLRYRHSRAMEENWIILEAVFELAPGDPETIGGRMEELRIQRTEKQPLEFPSAGSTFKRPEGYFAGKLIMDAGLAGFSVGDAQVSEKHCGFVINRGTASADDVRTLIRQVQEKVLGESGILLEPEVRFLGF